MKYLLIQGEKKRIPQYPHHKDFVYRCYRFFEVKNLYSFLTVDGLFFLPKRFYLTWKYKTVVPRLLLIDPTSACNLKCKGCWAADYQKNSHLSYEKLDEVLTEARKAGVLQVIMSGGEPLMRKTDVINLCAKHKNLTFALFTNGTLIDETFVKELVRLENLNVYISLEGFREETDSRRGPGTFDKVVAVMEMLKKHDIGFGFSVCYHKNNFETVSSDSFLDFMRERGAWLGWMFNYLPIGSDADLSLCCNAEQRAFVKRKIEAYHLKHKFTIIDFANQGHKAIGCVAAGNDFVHINASGDVEPCAFCHYSDVNINNMSFVEALRSPFLKNFRSYKPFSRNLLRPCPLIDIPDALIKVTEMEGVRSTHLYNPETPHQLAEKTRPLAEKWEPVANKLFEEMPDNEKNRFGILTKLLFWGNNQITKW